MRGSLSFDIWAILSKVPAGTVHQLWNNGVLKLAHCQCPCIASVQVCPQYFREIRNREPSGQTFKRLPIMISNVPLETSE
ncbi:hypothetical protein T01_1334 [Trichinella spiralis]|uniref:Uncharacterized protein n=1 Tax=Trichinella spiralis TaxID=6334 RepID=A0A0V1BNJ3_TRISP|nr:hypothetical protein T01_1334 [Trichinella spiralis]